MILDGQPLEVWGKAGNIGKLIRRQPSKARLSVFGAQTVWSTQHVVLRLVSKGLCVPLTAILAVPALADCRIVGGSGPVQSLQGGGQEWGTHIHMRRAWIHCI